MVNASFNPSARRGSVAPRPAQTYISVPSTPSRQVFPTSKPNNPITITSTQTHIHSSAANTINSAERAPIFPAQPNFMRGNTNNLNLAPSGLQIALGGSIINVTGDEHNIIEMWWPDNEARPLPYVFLSIPFQL